MREHSLAGVHGHPVARTSSVVSTAPVRIGVFGMAPDTGNMGVSALCSSYLAAIRQRLPNSEIVLFDNGTGLRPATAVVADGRVPLTLCGARGGRRYYRAGNLHTMSFLARLGKAATMNPVLKLIDSCSAIMDVSAGDSFSDIYGDTRFRNIWLPKHIAVRRSRPLLLLPQTYGPFRSSRNARLAREAILGCGEAWARDEHSFGVLRDLLGDDFDPRIHRSGVDMAFGLPVRVPDRRILGELQDWFADDTQLAGFNVSGLVWHMGREDADRFGFKADYRELVRKAVAWMLTSTESRVLLVPHVLAPSGSAESDADAARALVRLLDPDGGLRDRIRIAPENLNEQELKWLIGHCDWFCGTRMHSTIASLSSGVPTASIVYSDKAAGVFECCGQQDHVIDPRTQATGAALDHFIASFQVRGDARERLAEALVGVNATLDEQTRSIARFAVTHA